MTWHGFVGRASELARASRAIDGVLSGQAGLLLLVGEAGIGKTRLADSVAHEAQERGFRVAWGRCWEAGGAPAYWPWTQVFRSLGVEDLFEAGEGRTMDAQELRFRQYERAARQLEALAAESPIVIILDDLHTADLPSLGLLHAVARSAARARVLVIGTYRDADARLRADAWRLLAKIARESEHMELGRLDRDEVSAWLRAAAAELSEDVAEHVQQLSEGNPLFIHEMLRLGKRLDARRLPDGLRAIFDEHLARVPDGVRQLLAIASVLGREIELPEVVVLSERDADAVEADLALACDADLIEPIAGSPERYSFVHILLRERLFRQLTCSRRAALHWRVGECFAERGDLERAAHHLLEGRSAGQIERAAAVAGDAARLAMRRFAFEPAAQLARAAIDAIAQSGSAQPELSCQLEILRAEALMRAGELDDGRAACVRAAKAARRIGSAELEARAALVFGTEVASGSVDDTMVRLLRDALAALPVSDDEPLRARVMMRLAAALSPATAADAPEVVRLKREALASARRHGDRATLLEVSYHATLAEPYSCPRQERFDIVRDAIGLAADLGESSLFLKLSGWWIYNLYERGLHGEVDRAIEAFTVVVREFPQPQYQWRLPMLRATGALLAGDLTEAAHLGRATLAIAERGSIVWGQMSWAIHRIALAQAAGDPAHIAPDAERVVAILARSPRLAPVVAWVLAAVGRDGEARKMLARAEFHEHGHPTCLIGTQAALLLGDRELAGELLPILRGLPGECDVFWGPWGGGIIGPTSRVMADVAAALGRTEEARALYDDAIAVARRIGAVPLIELAQKARDSLGDTAPSDAAALPASSSLSPRPVALVREGGVWTLTSFSGNTVRLKDGKGIRYLARLLSSPDQELHVADLAGLEQPASDAGPMLDPQAKLAYRRRLEDLRDQLDEAQGFGDPTRAARAQEEIDALGRQLAAAVGLGGRDRLAGSLTERARVNVQRRIRDALERIDEQDPALGRYLKAAVHTGVYCSYAPP